MSPIGLVLFQSCLYCRGAPMEVCCGFSHVSTQGVRGVLVTSLFASGFSGQLETVDLNKLNEIEGSLNSAKDQMKDSDLDQKVSFLEREAKKQDDAIQAYNRDIEEILKDISNLEDIRKTLPSGCFNTPSIEKP